MEGFDDLEIGALRGAGGFAQVYEGREPSLDRRVAVKVFTARVDGAERRSFEREATALGRLSGIRNVVQVYRSGVTGDGRPYLVMELMEGSAADLLRDGPIEPARALSIGLVLSRALAEAHRLGILHRDVKPGNVLIDRYGEPALSDFGIAALVPLDGPSSIAAFTAEHSAPEVLEFARATEASDVYSLASTVHTLLEGTPPFQRRDDEGPLAFMQRVREEPCPRSVAAASLGDELADLLCAAMAKRPEDRPSLAEFAAGLAAHGGDAEHPLHLPLPRPERRWPDPSPPHLGADTTEPPTGRRRRARLIAVAGAALAVMGVGVAALALSSERAATPERVVSASGGPGAPTSVAGASTVPAPGVPDGVSNPRPVDRGGLRDASGALRSAINAFAADASAPALQPGGVRIDRNAAELGFGVLPSMVDYAGTNALTSDRCTRVVVRGLETTGATASIWLANNQVVYVTAFEFADEADARSYFWASSLFLGIPDDHCEGWPPGGIAVDPDDLRVDRHDFDLDLGTDPGDLVTVINDDPVIENLSVGIVYQGAARVGSRAVIASVGWTNDDLADQPAAVALIESALRRVLDH
jgi:tRNA A-37 threonylcarbamoyl transferase component Bud32